MILAVGLSNGIAISKALIFKKYEKKIKSPETDNIPDELAKVDYCFRKAGDELKSTFVERRYGSQIDKVLGKYMKSINSPSFIKDIKDKVANEEVSAEYAIFSTMEGCKRIVENLDDEYLQEKSQDIEEIEYRLLNKLINYKPDKYKNINEECIVVADNLTAGDILNMDKRYVKGIVIIFGGPSSSAGTAARYMHIPLVAAAGDDGYNIKNGDLLIVDGGNGKVIINPDENELKSYGSLFQ